MFKFRNFLFDPSRQSLLQGRKEFRLEPKMSELLYLFVTSSNEVLLKNDLMSTLWNDEIVTDDSLKRLISKLRKVFKDEARNPKFIETITSKGYRFIPKVTIASLKKTKFKKAYFVVPLILITLFFLPFKKNTPYKSYTMEKITEGKAEQIKATFQTADKAIAYIEALKPFAYFNIVLLKNGEKNTLPLGEYLKSDIAFSSRSEEKIIFRQLKKSGGELVEYNLRSNESMLLGKTKLVKRSDLDADENYIYFNDNVQDGIAIKRYERSPLRLVQISFPKNSEDLRFSISKDSKRLAIIRRKKNAEMNLILLDLNTEKERVVRSNTILKDLSWNKNNVLYLLVQRKQKNYLSYLNSKEKIIDLMELPSSLSSLDFSDYSHSALSSQWYRKRSIHILNIKTKKISELNPVARSNFDAQFFGKNNMIYLSDRKERTNLYYSDGQKTLLLSEAVGSFSLSDYEGKSLFVQKGKKEYQLDLKSKNQKEITVSEKQFRINGERYFYDENSKRLYQIKSTGLRKLVAVFQNGSPKFKVTASGLYLLRNHKLFRVHQAKLIEINTTFIPRLLFRNIAISKTGIYWIETNPKGAVTIKKSDFASKSIIRIHSFKETPLFLRNISVNEDETKILFQKLDEVQSNIIKFNFSN